MRFKKLLISATIALSSFNAFSATPEQAAEKLESFLQGFPELGPGYAVVAVTADKVLLNYVDGERNAKTKAPVTTDTPMYIASQTKAYMGLLANILDQKGILKLNSKITDHWPKVQFPKGVDPWAYTMADLINHRVPISVDVITFLEAYVTELDYKDYPFLIAKHGKKRDDGFEYDNLGYNIYSAILHKVTGKSWQVWLDDEIFNPLKLSRTSARTSDFSMDELAWNHIWQGKEKGWHLVKPKTDEIMQSSGGLVTSNNDMAKWLQLQLNAKKSSLINSKALVNAQTISANYEKSKRNPYELPCYGYSFGWNVCDYEENKVYIHGGGYTGARTMMAFSHDLGVGIAVFSNSDNMTAWLTSRTINMYFQYLIDHPKAEKMAAVRQKLYPERIGKYLDYRLSKLEKSKQSEDFKAWDWKPAKSELKAYLGTYRSKNIPVDVAIKLVGNQLIAQAKSYKVNLLAATKDSFASQSHPLEEVSALKFKRSKQGDLLSFEWDGEVYVKQ